MRATDGAIDAVEITEQGVALSVLGDSRPAGICGSGMIKAVAELLKVGLIEASGRLRNPKDANIPATLAQRLKNQGKGWEFVLAEGQATANGNDISVTQQDIRQIQLAKSAICTGIEFLMKELSIAGDFTVYLAGAFGNYVDIDSAIRIGMLPAVKKEYVVSVGNAAGTGAVQALASAEHLQRCFAVVNQVKHIELAAQVDFQDRFMENLSFPEIMQEVRPHESSNKD